MALADAHRRRRLAVATKWIESRYTTTLISGIADELRQRGVSTVCFSLGHRNRQGDGSVADHPLWELIGPENVEGLVVVAPAVLADDSRAFLARFAPLPTVSVGQRVEGVPSVWLHNAAGVRAMMDHLVDRCQRRRIAFIRGPTGNPEAEARWRAYEDMCVELSLGIDESLIEHGDFSEVSGRSAMERLLARTEKNPLDAVFAANDLMALGAEQALSAHRRQVPQEVAVVGFDDLEAIFGDPPLTTVRQPTYAIGRHAADLAERMVVGAAVPQPPPFPPELVVRDSCGAPPSVPRQAAPAADPGRALFFSAWDLGLPRRFAELPVMLRQLRDRTLAALPHSRGRRDPCVRGFAAFADQLDAAVHQAHASDLALHTARSQALQRLRRALVFATDREEVGRAVEIALPALSLESFSISVFEGERRELARVLLQVDDGVRIPAVDAPAAARYALGAVTLEEDRPATWLVLPIEDEAGVLGFVAARGQTYDMPALAELVALVAPALRRTHLP
jgi:DNA-binding LacI/PurR family transcriptional regulator